MVGMTGSQKPFHHFIYVVDSPSPSLMYYHSHELLTTGILVYVVSEWNFSLQLEANPGIDMSPSPISSLNEIFHYKLRDYF